VPAPCDGEILVRIEAIGLNRAEAAFRSGQYLEAPVMPARIGYEASGIVEALGSGVTELRVGDEVCILPTFSMNQYGVYAERAIVPAKAVFSRPAHLSALESASIWMQYLTAYGGLIEVGGLGAGDAVLISAASSSVGIGAIQIANMVGAVAIAVTRTQAKKAELQSLGARHVVTLDSSDLIAEVKRITGGRGVRLAFDPVGGPWVGKLAQTVAFNGQIVLYGNLSGHAFQTIFPFAVSASKAVSMRAYLVFETIADPLRFSRARTFIEGGLREGALRPKIARVFAFSDMVDAHTYLERNEHVGKIVVSGTA